MHMYMPTQGHQGFTTKFATGGGGGFRIIYKYRGWAKIKVFPLHQIACHVVFKCIYKPGGGFVNLGANLRVGRGWEQ